MPKRKPLSSVSYPSHRICHDLPTGVVSGCDLYCAVPLAVVLSSAGRARIFSQNGGSMARPLNKKCPKTPSLAQLPPAQEPRTYLLYGVRPATDSQVDTTIAPTLPSSRRLASAPLFPLQQPSVAESRRPAAKPISGPQAAPRPLRNPHAPVRDLQGPRGFVLSRPDAVNPAALLLDPETLFPCVGDGDAMMPYLTCPPKQGHVPLEKAAKMTQLRFPSPGHIVRQSCRVSSLAHRNVFAPGQLSLTVRRR